MRVVPWSTDSTCTGDAIMARARLTLVVTDLKTGQIVFASGTLNASQLAPIQPMLLELAAAMRARDETIGAPGARLPAQPGAARALPTFVATHEMVPSPTVGRLVHVDLDRQVALWELESRNATHHPSTSPFVDELPTRRAPRAPRRLVCVDNDPDGLEVLRLTLTTLPGVEFVSATTGREGLTLLHESRPSLLLIDLQLPDVSGASVIELCGRSVSLSSVPIVVLTADASVATRRVVEAFGVAHLAVKPFDLVELREVVEHLLARG